MGIFGEPAAAEPPLYRRIDAAIDAAHAGPVAAQSTDGEFVRRVFLDLTGRIPSAEAAREFLDDPSPYKRAALIDELLERPDFSRRMAQLFDVIWMERRPDKVIPAAEWQEYLRKSFADRKPYNKLVAEVLASDGATSSPRPAAKFFLDRDGEPNLLTRDVGRMFLGMDLQCAQCHDHPLVDSYYQRDYYGLMAFLNRSFVFTDPQQVVSLAEKAEGDVTFKSVFDPDAQPAGATPHLPGADPLDEPQLDAAQAYLVAPAEGVRPIPRYSRRSQLAQQATGGSNADFNRNIANRIWAIMLGRGLVHPVDFRHDDNPPSHPELLDLLATELVAANFDLRALIREIALSEAYQRSSESPPGATAAELPPESFALAQLKPLSPEQLAWSVMEATGIVENQRAAALSQVRSDSRLAELLAADEKRGRLEEEMVETTVHTALAGNAGPFVNLFAGTAGPSAQDYQSTVHQALFVSNGDHLRSWLQPGGGNLSERLNAAADPRAVAEELYLGILSRRPSRDEQSEIAAYLAPRAADRPAAVQELVWALLASAEFRFNH